MSHAICHAALVWFAVECCWAQTTAVSYDKLIDQAKQFLQQGHSQEALSASQKAIRINDQRYEAHVLAAAALGNQKNYDEAIGQLQIALTLAPEPQKAGIRKAIDEYRAQASNSASPGNRGPATAGRPLSSEDMAKLAEARAAYSHHDCPAALEALHGASLSAQENADYVLATALAQECANHFTLALKSYEQYVKLAPGQQEVADKIAELQYTVRKTKTALSDLARLLEESGLQTSVDKEYTWHWRNELQTSNTCVLRINRHTYVTDIDFKGEDEWTADLKKLASPKDTGQDFFCPHRIKLETAADAGAGHPVLWSYTSDKKQEKQELDFLELCLADATVAHKAVELLTYAVSYCRDE